MTRGPDPNRWTPPEPGAREDDRLGMHERPASTGLRWFIVGGVVLLTVVILILMA